ncbi:hypothetical protein GCM10019059_31900 [Camelimonas fluminis]|uniref:50S ribosomal protein L11 methyltransferase n=1 Tax=Camelimonas fluminis TaxID=1576911 RepID=A0ABV7UI82_9HYPH|nr:hypothetical protein [Camelimonas fluminis]GHE69818.1 hypothetical protein GCM10019059_31900 [Camelimonas fluminis]
MSDWIRVTIACPEAMIADANQLASVLGFSAADANTFGEPVWQDAEGNRYAVASTLAKPAFVTDAMSPLLEPPWGADMEAAARAQEWLAVFDPATDSAPFANPVHLAAVLYADAPEALAILGVTPVASE